MLCIKSNLWRYLKHNLSLNILGPYILYFNTFIVSIQRLTGLSRFDSLVVEISYNRLLTT